jgi:hypothetical protein
MYRDNIYLTYLTLTKSAEIFKACQCIIFRTDDFYTTLEMT